MKKKTKIQIPPSRNQALPTKKQLMYSIEAAFIVALLLLVVFVLPVEFGIDPTGLGQTLGLNFLSVSDIPDKDSPNPNMVLTAKAEAAFGRNRRRSFNAVAVSFSDNNAPRESVFRLTLEPGKGSEVKAQLRAGDGFSFRWTATGDVAVDMHGERTNTNETWTTYAAESAQREASGTFVAPFDGSHGWYWRNVGSETVVVEIQTFGFQQGLYQLP